MLTRDKLISDLDYFSTKLGFNANEVKQGSTEWQKMKLGVLSASEAKSILMKKDSETRKGYMAELVAQVCTKEMPEINAKALEWGKANEESARSAYEFLTESKVEEFPFVYKDELMRVGFSPDGLIFDQQKGLELKCPFNSKVYIQFVTDGKIKDEYEKQCQMALWCSKWNIWDLANYDPRMTKKVIHAVAIERDESLMKTFDDAIPQFIYEMDKMLESFGVEFGDQWKA